MLFTFNLGATMKSFTDYIAMKEIAVYGMDQAEDRPRDEDPQTQASMAAVAESLKKIMKSRPEMVVAFLNLHRTDPDIKEILRKHNLDSFLDPKGSKRGDYRDKGLGDEEGEANMLAPQAADGHTGDPLA